MHLWSCTSNCSSSPVSLERENNNVVDFNSQTAAKPIAGDHGMHFEMKRRKEKWDRRGRKWKREWMHWPYNYYEEDSLAFTQQRLNSSWTRTTKTEYTKIEVEWMTLTSSSFQCPFPCFFFLVFLLLFLCIMMITWARSCVNTYMPMCSACTWAG